MMEVWKVIAILWMLLVASFVFGGPSCGSC